MGVKKNIRYIYEAGLKVGMVDPDGGRFTYSYDDARRITQVINPQGERTSYSYDAGGRRTAKMLANGSRTSFTYDGASRITTVAHLKSDNSVQAKYDYKYDKAGNRTGMAETGHTTGRTTWSYDAAYQLTGEHRTGSNAFRHTFTYDNRGNRTLKVLNGVRTTSTYDAANQLKWSEAAGGRTTYVFDADGNQQAVIAPDLSRTTSVWDYENKLVGVLNPSGIRETMAYDPDGKRVKHQTASDTVKYVWDQENYLAETNASDVTQAVYTNEPRTYGNLISQRKSGATHYYVFDALGSTRLLTDSSEAVSESLLYDAWGNLVGSAPTLAVPFRWVGELGYLFVPSTGDYSVRARVYRPSIGRWMSQDPLERIIYAYVYSLNSPFSKWDPKGTIVASAEMDCQNRGDLEIDSIDDPNSCYCDFGKCNFSIELRKQNDFRLCFDHDPSEPDNEEAPKGTRECFAWFQRTQDPDDHVVAVPKDEDEECRITIANFPPNSPEPIWDSLPEHCRPPRIRFEPPCLIFSEIHLN